MKHAVLALAAAVGIVSAAPAAALTIIDFEDLGAAQGVSFFSGIAEEDGFTLDFDLMFISSGSDSTPIYEIAREAFTEGALTLSKGGERFAFASIDWKSQDVRQTSTADIELEGFVGIASAGIDVFSTGSLDYATFAAVNLAGVMIDRLVIRADRLPGKLGAFDTVALETRGDDAAVPVPAAGGLLILGVGALAALRRRA